MRFVCGERICLERVRDTERWEWKRNEEIVINLSPLSLTYVSNNSYNNDLVVIIIIIIFFLIKFNQYEIPTNLRVTTNNITRVLEIRPSTLEFKAHIWIPGRQNSNQSRAILPQFYSSRHRRKHEGLRDKPPRVNYLTPTLLLLSPPCFFPQQQGRGQSLLRPY